MAEVLPHESARGGFDVGQGLRATSSEDTSRTNFVFHLVFGLPLRQAEGFRRSVLSLMHVELNAPDHTTLSRRSQHVEVELHRPPVIWRRQLSVG